MLLTSKSLQEKIQNLDKLISIPITTEAVNHPMHGNNEYLDVVISMVSNVKRIVEHANSNSLRNAISSNSYGKIVLSKHMLNLSIIANASGGTTKMMYILSDVANELAKSYPVTQIWGYLDDATKKSIFTNKPKIGI